MWNSLASCFGSTVLLSMLAVRAAFGQEALDPNLPVYRPASELQGTLSLVGSSTMSHVASVWATDFRRFYPDVNISIEIRGSRNAVTSVQEGEADFGLLSRRISEQEVAGFKKQFGYEPKVLTPCVERIAVYVHKDNPIRGMTLEQLDAIYSTTCKRGAAKTIQKWSELGVTGPLAAQPIAVHGRAKDTGSQVFLRDSILLGGSFRSDLQSHENNLTMVAAVAKDPRAIGFAGLSYGMPDVRAVPLAVDGRGPYVSVDSNRARYPLVQPLQLVVKVDPKNDLRPIEREFIKYVFSRLGQEDVIKAGFEVTPVQAVHVALDSVGLGVAR